MKTKCNARVHSTYPHAFNASTPHSSYFSTLHSYSHKFSPRVLSSNKTRWCCSFFCSLLSASQIKNVVKERSQTSWPKGELFKKLVVKLIMIKRSVRVRRRGKKRRGRSPSTSGQDSRTHICHLPLETARPPSSHPAPYSTASHFLSRTGNRD